MQQNSILSDPRNPDSPYCAHCQPSKNKEIRSELGRADKDKMSNLRLYTFPGNKNAWKAQIAAEYVGVKLDIPAFEMGKTNKSPQFLKLNPNGKVTFKHELHFLPFFQHDR
jgi:hypothetical protein